MLKKILIIGIILVAGLVILGKLTKREEPEPVPVPVETQDLPHLASFMTDLEKYQANSQAQYDLVIKSVNEEEAKVIRERNPKTLILFQASAHFTQEAALPVLEKVAGQSFREDFWLKNRDGSRCQFSKTYPLYALDIQNAAYQDFIANFYKNLIKYQPHYNGVFLDIVDESSKCDSVTDEAWREATTKLLAKIREAIGDKILLANSGYNYSESTPYLTYLNGYSLESFLGPGASFEEGLSAAKLIQEKTRSPHFLIYDVDTGPSKVIDQKKMRLGLALSLLQDFTYLSYDFPLEEHGQVLWFSEYESDLGQPLDTYTKRPDSAYQREFEKGWVFASAAQPVKVDFTQELTDLTNGQKIKIFYLEKGDGRIFLK